LKKTQQIVNQTLQHNGESEESAQLQKRASKYSEIALLLKRTTYKDHVMRECMELFYDRDFLQELDMNPHLLCFNNGVYDFGEKVFRPGHANDYVSLCTNTDYVPVDEVPPETLDAVKAFMTQLFPDDELREYVWDHLGAVLPGLNDNQTFNIYSGIGSNGKSKLVELMGLALGDYKGTVPITMVVGRRTNIGSASPEIAQLKGKRYAVMQEPTKGDKINEGILKEMTGEDPIQGRHLYCNTVTYIPMFTLVVCCNDLPAFKSNDEGTWRRVRLCKFRSCFVDPSEEAQKRKEYPNVKHWWPKDKKLGDKLKSWVGAFTALLIERVNATGGIVQDCDAVMRESRQYRTSQDVLELFRQERIRESPGEWLNITVVWNDFQEWFREAYPSRRSLPERRELRDALEKVLGPTTHTRGWKNYTSGPVTEDGDYEE
jgi:P4 family phage/plasmid primase-like protien